MSFSYDPALATDKDKVRFFISDTDEASAYMADEGINTLLDLYDDVYLAAAAACDSLAARFAKIASITIDGFTVKGVDRAEEFRQQAFALRRNSASTATGALGVPLVGGISKGEMESVNANTDRVPNKFNVGQTDFPGTITAWPPTYSDRLP